MITDYMYLHLKYIGEIIINDWLDLLCYRCYEGPYTLIPLMCVIRKSVQISYIIV